MNNRLNEFRNKANNLLEYVKPRFSELTTFQAAVTSILLLIYYPDIMTNFFIGITKYLNNISKPSLYFLSMVIVVLLVSIAGVGLSIWHVIIKRKKRVLEKWIMGAFAIIASGLAGILATIELLPNRWSVLLVFPIWNYLWGLLLVDRLAAPHEAITDEDATIIDVILTTLILGLTFFSLRLFFDYSWPIIFSICMSVTSLLLMIYHRVVVTIQNIA